MVYELHITRQHNWFDNNANQKISLEEWKDFLQNDSEMRLDKYVEATIATDRVLKIENEGLSVWTKYSGEGVDGNRAWFDYDHGSITIKNPGNEIITKMLAIVNKPNAEVQGDDCKAYELVTNG